MASIFQFEPHKGFGPIVLGSSRAHVRATMASANLKFESSRDTMDYFARNAIQVEYGEDGNAEAAPAARKTGPPSHGVVVESLEDIERAANAIPL